MQCTRYALKVTGESSLAEFFSEVCGFYVGWAEGGLFQHQYPTLKELARGVAYAETGSVGKAVSLFGHLPLNHSASLLLQRLLPAEMRRNILAEYLYGQYLLRKCYRRRNG